MLSNTMSPPIHGHDAPGHSAGPFIVREKKKNNKKAATPKKKQVLRNAL